MGTKVQHLPQYAAVPGLLRRLREEAQLAQRPFAERIQRTQTFVQQSETGSRRVDFSEFVMWAKACGVDPHQALAWYLAATYPGQSHAAKPYPAYKPPAWQVNEDPARRERARKITTLLDEAKALLAADGKKGGRRSKSAS